MSNYFEPKREPLGEILRKFRKENGYTQQYLADYLKVDRTTYAKYEAKRKPVLDVVVQLAALYGVTVEDLLGDYAETTVDQNNLKAYSRASTPDTKNLDGLSRDELNLLSFFRKSIRKSDILTYARKIASEDIKSADKPDND